MQFLFDIDIATKYGVNEAIFLNNIAHWTKINQANETNLHDGRTWTYNSYPAFTKIFPFWTQKQIRTIIASCESKKLICSGNYNVAKYDRTKWYSLTDLGIKLFPGLTCPNGRIDLPKEPEPSAQMGALIPVNKPDNKPDIKQERVKRPPRPSTSVPLDFIPNEHHALIAAVRHLDLNNEKSAFIDYYEAHGKKMVNWDAAFRNWLRKAAEFKNKSQGKEHPVTASIREVKEDIYNSSEFKYMMN